MEAKIIDEHSRDIWNEFIVRSPASPILQSFEWGELKSFFGWQPIRIAVFEGDKIVAGASILKRRIPCISRSIFYLPRGPIVDFKDSKVLGKLLEAVVLEAKKHKAILVKIDPFILEEDQEAVKAVESLGFIRKKKQIQPRATLHIDLSSGLEEIWLHLKKRPDITSGLQKEKG